MTTRPHHQPKLALSLRLSLLHLARPPWSTLATSPQRRVRVSHSILVRHPARQRYELVSPGHLLRARLFSVALARIRVQTPSHPTYRATSALRSRALASPAACACAGPTRGEGR